MNNFDKIALIGLLAAGIGGAIYWKKHQQTAQLVNTKVQAQPAQVPVMPAPPAIPASVGQNVGNVVTQLSQGVNTGVQVVQQVVGFANQIGGFLGGLGIKL